MQGFKRQTWRSNLEKPQMHFEDMKADWNSFKAQIRQRWSKLTDDELVTINGDRSQLEAALVAKYGFTPEKAHDEVDNWCNNYRP